MITELEEKAYRLRHHSFAGRTTMETAEEMNITCDKVRLLMSSLRAKAPHLFPILTHRQHVVYWLYVKRGLPIHKIATVLNTVYSNVWDILNRVKQKGMPFLEISGFGDMVSYENGMDSYISYRF